MNNSTSKFFVLTLATLITVPTFYSAHLWSANGGANDVDGANGAAKTFSATDLLGKEIVVNPAKAEKATVLVFLSAKCPCSASHEVILKNLHEEFYKKGFQFYAIHSNTDEDSAMTKNHFNQSNLPFAVLQDEKAKIANELGALKTPHVFLLGKNGEVEFQGGVDDSNNAAHAKKPYLKEAMIALLEGKKPNPKEVRALGCIIKRD